MFSPGLSLREWTCKEDKLLLVSIFEFSLHKREAFVGSGGRKPAVSVEVGMIERSDPYVDLFVCISYFRGLLALNIYTEVVLFCILRQLLWVASCSRLLISPGGS